MKENDYVLDSTNIQKLVDEGMLPKDLGNFEIEDLQNFLDGIEKIQKLKEKGTSQTDIVKILQKNSKTKKEIEKTFAIYKLLQDNKKTIKKILGDERLNKGKFRQSGHLADQTLKYNSPTDSQLTIFDILSKETVQKIEDSKIQVTAEGIRLTPSEDKMIKAINKLLQEKNQIFEKEIENNTTSLCEYGGNGQTGLVAYLKIFPCELYEAYLDRHDYSGEEIKFIKKILFDLCEKKFLIKYDRKRKEGNKQVTDRIEDFQSLVKIVHYLEGLSDSELKKLDSGDQKIREKKGELLIALNPIFLDQIHTKYIEYPHDINKRTTIASGGHQCVTESIVVLRDYMLREISSKRYQVEINEEKIPFLLRLDNYVKNRKKKLIQDRICGAIDAVKRLGIINDVEKVIGSKGQNKYIFFLNEHFE